MTARLLLLAFAAACAWLVAALVVRALFPRSAIPARYPLDDVDREDGLQPADEYPWRILARGAA